MTDRAFSRVKREARQQDAIIESIRNVSHNEQVTRALVQRHDALLTGTFWQRLRWLLKGL